MDKPAPNSLEDIRIQFIPDADQLNENQQTAHRYDNQGINKAAAEADTTNGCGAHPANDNELPHIVHWFSPHENVKLGGSF